MGIDRDEKYFPQPMDYKPERYSEEKEENNLVAFMPFGDGPRYCIGRSNSLVFYIRTLNMNNILSKF